MLPKYIELELELKVTSNDSKQRKISEHCAFIKYLLWIVNRDHNPSHVSEDWPIRAFLSGNLRQTNDEWRIDWILFPGRMIALIGEDVVRYETESNIALASSEKNNVYE